MHGPYRAEVSIRGEGTIVLSRDDVAEGDRIADRFYNSGGGTAVLAGFTRAAVFTVGLLLDPGQEAEVEIVGRVGSEPRADDVVAKTERVRRDDDGRLVSTLGSRFGERGFVGV